MTNPWGKALKSWDRMAERLEGFMELYNAANKHRSGAIELGPALTNFASWGKRITVGLEVLAKGGTREEVNAAMYPDFQTKAGRRS